uniref:YdbS-like PH domain-containing protein n=1 Tax=Tetradesmus obliquus TaxID=3088 RepID=A0A383WHG8_TETOB|eukprot:jgi/Sobl393_1/2721/SZX76703.1
MMLSCRARSASCTVQQRTLQPNLRPAPFCVLPARSRRQAGLVKADSSDSSTSTTGADSVPAAAPARTSRGPAAVNDSIPEELFYEGSGSNAELVLSLILAATLVYIPITIAIVGKRLWIKYRFTNKRVTIINTSPLFAKTVEVAYSQIAEVRTAPRAFGLWGDCVIFLKNGDRLEITGLERHQEIKRHIMSCIID